MMIKVINDFYIFGFIVLEVMFGDVFVCNLDVEKFL